MFDEDLPEIVLATKYRLNTMESAIWLAKWTTEKHGQWMTFKDAAHGMGYKPAWMPRVIKSVKGREWLYKSVVVHGTKVAFCDVWEIAQHVLVNDFLTYSGIYRKTLRNVARNNGIEIYRCPIRKGNCIKFSDACDILFWCKIKSLTSNYFPFKKAMQIKNLSWDMLMEYICRYNLKQSW